MKLPQPIDTTFDVRSDAGVTRSGDARDPDKHSPTLRQYHRLLWSKPLPGGQLFRLDDSSRGEYLHHRSDLGEFYLGSDSIIHTMTSFAGMSPITKQVPEPHREEFLRIGCTIGGMTLFPSNRIDGKPTINGARGMHPGIGDRFDLTLECIRRHYAGRSPNPLEAVLKRYADLFDDFTGYIDFFLLQDLVTEDHSAVRFFTPFTDFPVSPLPRTLNAYNEYRRRSIGFVEARNARIDRAPLP